MPGLFLSAFNFLNSIKPPNPSSITTDHEIDTLDSLPQQPVNLTSSSILSSHSSQQKQQHHHPYTTSVTAPTMSIFKAAEQNNLSAIKYYIMHTTSVDPVTLLNTRDPESNSTLLHLSIINSNKTDKSALPVLELLLDHGADVTARSTYSVQAIHMASLHSPDPLSSIELLLNHGASPNARDGDGWTPLHYTARFCQPPDAVLQLLVARGADINLTDAAHKSPVFGLIANGDLTSALDWCIHMAGADLLLRGDFLVQTNRKTRSGTVVLQAAKYGRVKCLELLIRSSVAMGMLKKVIAKDELVYATWLVKEQLAKLDQAAGSADITKEQKVMVNNFEMVLTLLQELEDMLEKDPSSLLGAEKIKKNKAAVQMLHQQDPSTSGVSKGEEEMDVVKRKRSFISVLGSIRRAKKRPLRENTLGTETASTDSLMRRMSKLIRRTKSENNTIVLNQNKLQQNNMDGILAQAGMSR